MVQARSLLFTIYGDLIMRYGQDVWIGSLIRALSEFGLQAPAVRMAVSRSVRDGLLRALTDDKKGYYTLTEKGRNRLENGTRRAYRQLPEPWDGQWRVVTLSMPENRRDLRDRIGAEMEWRGFGRITPNTWVSPHRQEDTIRLLAAEYDLLGYLHQFTARYGGPQTDREVAAQCWDLPKIAAKYQEFNAEVQGRIDSMRERLASGIETPDNYCFVERIWLVHEWRKSLHFDPDLPVELLPSDWPGALPRQLFWEYYKLLSSGAEHFFLELFHAPAVAVGAAGHAPTDPKPTDSKPAVSLKRRSLLRQEW